MSNFYTTEVRLDSMNVTTIAYNADSGVSIIELGRKVVSPEDTIHIRTQLSVPYEVLEEAFRLATLAKERVLSEGKDLEFFWASDFTTTAV
jgi:hypothetical protein